MTPEVPKTIVTTLEWLETHYWRPGSWASICLQIPAEDREGYVISCAFGQLWSGIRYDAYRMILGRPIKDPESLEKLRECGFLNPDGTVTEAFALEIEPWARLMLEFLDESE